MLIKEQHNQTPSKTIFSVFGSKEPIATASLAYVLAKYPDLTKSILRKLIPRIRFDFGNLIIEKEKHREKAGRTDIEISNAKFIFVFEGKIGSSLPSFGQTQKYVRELKREKQSIKLLVFLVSSRPDAERTIRNYISKNKTFRDVLGCITWSEILKEITKILKDSKKQNEYLLFDFWNFLNREVTMKSFEQEVMIIGINKSFRYKKGNLPNIVGLSSSEAVHKELIYQGGEQKIKSVLYLAFREEGKLKYVSRVKRQELSQNRRMAFYLEKLLDLSVIRKVPFAYRLGIQHTSFQKLLDMSLLSFKDIIEKNNDAENQ